MASMAMAAAATEEEDKNYSMEEKVKEQKEEEKDEEEKEGQKEEEKDYYIVPGCYSDYDSDTEIPVDDFIAPGEWEADYVRAVYERREKLPPITEEDEEYEKPIWVTITVVDDVQVEVPIKEEGKKEEGVSAEEENKKKTKTRTFIKRVTIQIPWEHYLDLVIAYNDWKPKRPNQVGTCSYGTPDLPFNTNKS